MTNALEPEVARIDEGGAIFDARTMRSGQVDALLRGDTVGRMISRGGGRIGAWCLSRRTDSVETATAAPRRQRGGPCGVRS